MDARERRPGGGRRGSHAPGRRNAGAAADRRAAVSKRPQLYLVHGSEAPKERKLYRLRETRPHEAPGYVWPPAGEWRELVRRLTNHPVKSE
jgi:hypothetical protein